MGLTSAEIEHFRERGYVIPDFRLPDAILGRLRDSLDRLLATYTDVKPEDLANPTCFRRQKDRSATRLWKRPGTRESWIDSNS